MRVSSFGECKMHVTSCSVHEQLINVARCETRHDLVDKGQVLEAKREPGKACVCGDSELVQMALKRRPELYMDMNLLDNKLRTPKSY